MSHLKLPLTRGRGVALRQVRRALEYAEKGVRLDPHSSDALYAHATMLHKKAVTAVKDAAVPIPAQVGLLDRAADAFRRLQVRNPICCCVCRLGLGVPVGGVAGSLDCCSLSCPALLPV